MSVGVLPAPRLFHWESASKPALIRCSYRAASPHLFTTTNALTIHHPQYSCTPNHHHHPCQHHYLYHHHRPRRRQQRGETAAWLRCATEVLPPSLDSSWYTDTSSLLTTDTFSGRDSILSLTPDAFFVSRSILVSMSSAGASRTTIESSSGTSTAAAREVKQYLNRTLFPRPTSTLHGYASLYHRLKKLPASHRKTRQQAKAHLVTDSGSAGLRQEATYDADDINTIEETTHSSPRVEIHIYVPTAAAAATSAATAHEDDAALVPV
ncbi:hypothetical protein OTU49_016777 [Cherax quadricarinatus]|uniref:Uncharacterized protein n=1 Tax=Cherax quadricarinatus TaxID=27406 RepID=A0AAW0XU63_CHEQU